MTKGEAIQYIRQHVSIGSMMQALAEEACEVAQAAIKINRTMSKDNPTPMTIDEAVDNLTEEIEDVVNVLEVARILTDFDPDKEANEKMARWVQRIKAAKGEA